MMISILQTHAMTGIILLAAMVTHREMVISFFAGWDEGTPMRLRPVPITLFLIALFAVAWPVMLVKFLNAFFDARRS